MRRNAALQGIWCKESDARNLKRASPNPAGIKETAEDRQRDRARAEYADKYDMGGDMRVSMLPCVLLCIPLVFAQSSALASFFPSLVRDWVLGLLADSTPWAATCG